MQEAGTAYASFNYSGVAFEVAYNPQDASGLGAIREIVALDEYKLAAFAQTLADTPHKVLVDIGANIGIATIIMAKLNPDAAVLAYEPDPQTFALLCENLKLNKLGNVRAYQLAVTGTAKLATAPHATLVKYPAMTGANSTCASATEFRAQYGDASSLSVACTSLDQIVQEHHVAAIALLKIDCEGAEFEILYDCQALPQRRVHNLVGEFHNLAYNTAIPRCAANHSDELIAYCKQHIPGQVQVKTLTL